MKTERVIFVIVIVSLLMKLFHIPGGNVLIILSLSTLMFVYFPFGFHFFSDAKKKQRPELSIIAGMFLSIAVAGILFRLMRWPGAFLMLLVSALPVVGLLAVVFDMKRKASEELAGYYGNMVIRISVILVIGVGLYFMPKSAMRYISSTREDILREAYLKDTTNIEAKQIYERYMEERKKN